MRGMTLLELLLALALLGVLAAASLSWTATASRLSVEQSERLRWERAAAATLQAIHDGLAVGDFHPIADRAHGVLRVQLNERALGIRTREGGLAVLRVLWHDASAQWLLTWTTPQNSRLPASPPTETSIALGEVESLEIIENEERRLLVAINGTSGRHVERVFRVTP